MNKDLDGEIASRGGIEQIKKNVAKENVIPDEVKRVKKLVFTMYQEDPNLANIKSSIQSDILSKDELNKTIDVAINELENYINDVSIKSSTVKGSILGVLVSSLIGAAIWFFSIIHTGKIHNILNIAVALISYFIIKSLTKQSDSNTLVFISTFVSAFISLLLGLWFISSISN